MMGVTLNPRTDARHVLWVLRCAIGRGEGGPALTFALHVRNDNRAGTPPLAILTGAVPG
jgi:hypothetical protein